MKIHPLVLTAGFAALAACATQKEATIPPTTPTTTQQPQTPPPSQPDTTQTPTGHTSTTPGTAQPQSTAGNDAGRSEALRLADTIDDHLRRSATATGRDLSEHAEAIHRASEALAEPLREHPGSRAQYQDLRKHADKLLEASRKGDRKDVTHHRGDLEKALRGLRSTL